MERGLLPRSREAYFGGKSTVAAHVWGALGDCKHYIEPFCGSCAVLLARPDYRQGEHVETVNDADGHIANVWRALQFSPDEVARWCDWPVNHADLAARKKVLKERNGELLDALIADDKYHDPELAGYYIWGASCWIGAGLVCPGQIPYLGSGMGVHKPGKRPHLSNAGAGVHKLGRIPPDSPEGLAVTAPYNPNIYAWFRELSERLRYVRVVCGDWSRVCGGDWQDGFGTVGIFFDPPYGTKANRDPGLYAVDSLEVADEVRAWCLERGNRPSYRIVLAGYYD